MFAVAKFGQVNPSLPHLDTGETITRYDLWVSRPLDLTIPPWQPSLQANE